MKNAIKILTTISLFAIVNCASTTSFAQSGKSAMICQADKIVTPMPDENTQMSSSILLCDLFLAVS